MVRQVREHVIPTVHEVQDRPAPRAGVQAVGLAQSFPAPEVCKADPERRAGALQHFFPVRWITEIDEFLFAIEPAVGAVEQNREIHLQAIVVDPQECRMINRVAQGWVELDPHEPTHFDGLLEQIEVVGSLRVHGEEGEDTPRALESRLFGPGNLTKEAFPVSGHLVGRPDVHHQGDNRVPVVELVQDVVRHVGDGGLHGHPQGLHHVEHTLAERRGIVRQSADLVQEPSERLDWQVCWIATPECKGNRESGKPSVKEGVEVARAQQLSEEEPEEGLLVQVAGAVQQVIQELFDALDDEGGEPSLPKSLGDHPNGFVRENRPQREKVRVDVKDHGRLPTTSRFGHAGGSREPGGAFHARRTVGDSAPT